jgi:RNA polymerase sigma factor (sigma-70 family)
MLSSFEMTPELLQRVTAGDAVAFAELVRVVGPRLRRMAMSFFVSPFEQEEAVQEAFLHLYKQRALIDPASGDRVLSFVTTLARRRMIDLLRVRQAGFASEHPAPVPDAVGPYEAAAAKELEQLMVRFEGRLKPPFRRYFRAVFVNGQDEEQARISLEMAPLRARYVKRVLVSKLRRHKPLLERLQARGR